jgi:two-component system, NtrC family, response regulator HydG
MARENSKILAVDDNDGILKTLDFILSDEFGQVDTLRNPNALLSGIRAKEYDVILLDMNFSAGINTGNEGLYWLRKILETDPAAVVILITAYGDVKLAVKSMKEGAADFIQKPFDNPRLISTVRSALNLSRSKREIAALRGREKHLAKDLDKNYSIVHGESEAMKELYSVIRKVAPTDASVLITGDNGTGKEVLARELHRLSLRSGELFISVDLGSLSETLFESELFGHKKGAFTDAREDRIGRFEAASGGTLFLDEIGNLPLSLQSKLLRVIQTGEVIPVGSNIPVNVDVRLITATNRDLQKLIKDDLFREDLFFRINTIHLKIPPLRERKEDILPLAEYFLGRYARKYNKFPTRLNRDAADRLVKHNWPGNVRELQHLIENAVIMADSKTITGNDLRFSSSAMENNNGLPPRLNLNDIEKLAVKEALFKHNGNINQAAIELGITRKTLYSKIQKYEL